MTYDGNFSIETRAARTTRNNQNSTVPFRSKFKRDKVWNICGANVAEAIPSSEQSANLSFLYGV